MMQMVPGGRCVVHRGVAVWMWYVGGGGEWVALVGIGVGRLCQFDGGAGAGVCL